MKKVMTFTKSAQNSLDSETLSIVDLKKYPNDVYIMQHNSVVEDPITGQLVRCLYGYRTECDYICPHCTETSTDVVFLRTRYHLIIGCPECERFTWLSISKGKNKCCH